MSSVYIHIPFCASKCIYCDFYSGVYPKKQREKFIEALKNEIFERKNFLVEKKLKTLYFGGGTPSLLAVKDLQAIIETLQCVYTFDDNIEITLEGNPDDFTPTYIEELRQTPINRISLGVQTFNDLFLSFLNRRHTGAQVLKAIELLKEAGYLNISIDLIYGLPNQSLAQWEDDLKKALSLPITHLSAYALIYEENTPLMKLKHLGKVQEVSEEQSVECFQKLIEYTVNKGMVQYEISNFALPQYHSKHNTVYWYGGEYLGLGPAAHSYDGSSRYVNDFSLATYISVDGCVKSQKMITQEILSRNEQYNDFVLTRLRTSKGIDLRELQEMFSSDYVRYLHCMAKKYINQKQLIVQDQYLRFTIEGLFLSDGIMAELMKVD